MNQLIQLALRFSGTTEEAERLGIIAAVFTNYYVLPGYVEAGYVQ